MDAPWNTTFFFFPTSFPGVSTRGPRANIQVPHCFAKGPHRNLRAAERFESLRRSLGSERRLGFPNRKPWLIRIEALVESNIRSKQLNRHNMKLAWICPKCPRNTTTPPTFSKTWRQHLGYTYILPPQGIQCAPKKSTEQMSASSLVTCEKRTRQH